MKAVGVEEKLVGSIATDCELNAFEGGEIGGRDGSLGEGHDQIGERRRLGTHLRKDGDGVAALSPEGAGEEDDGVVGAGVGAVDEHGVEVGAAVFAFGVVDERGDGVYGEWRDLRGLNRGFEGREIELLSTLKDGGCVLDVLDIFVG